MPSTRIVLWMVVSCAVGGGPLTAVAAPPTAADALRLLNPVQPDVPHDRPSKDDIPSCRVEPLRAPGVTGWSVYGPSSQILRRFIDTNGDNRLDQWCYFHNGIEVYRDIDQDFNGTADQYRWLGTAGSRWGLDDDEDGVIDRWKRISPEEVTAEVVAAVRARDLPRFRRVLLRPEELDELGLGPDQLADLRQRIARAEEEFAEFAGEQTLVGSESKWVHFGATRPGILPEGTAGSTQDLLLYDQAAAIVETDGRHSQVIIGTLVRYDDGWRVIDLPRKDAAVGLFFTAIAGEVAAQGGADGVGLNRQMQELLAELEKLDQHLERARQADAVSALNARRADVLERIVAAAAGHEDRNAWIRQYADTISAAVQAGDYPEGVQRLNAMLARLEKEQLDADLRAFVRYRSMTAEYGQQVQAPDADFAKIQQQWLKQLEQFVKEHPRAEDAPDAMLQLALAQEFAGSHTAAGKWYARVASDFPDSPLAPKAAGAKRRLESVGQSISLSGRSLEGGSLDLASYRGHVVLIHYWATWCEPCKQDMQAIRALQAKFAGQRFMPLGINLDQDRRAAADFLKTQRMTWPQMHEDGGLESRLANELGVLTLPTMLLVDPSGRVVRRNIHAGELEEEVRKLLP